MHTHTYRFLSSSGQAENRTSQLPTTSQHQFLTLIVPHNHTIRIQAHKMPTHMSPTGTCMLMMEQVSVNSGSTSLVS